MAEQNPLQRLIASILPPKPTTRPKYPSVDPNPTPAKRVFDTGMDVVLGGLGVNDPLAPNATRSTGLGALLGMLGPAAMVGGLKQAGRGLYSRVDEALKLIPPKGAHPNKVMSLLRNNASGEELTWRGVPEFVQAQGNAPVTPEMLEAYLKANPAPMPETEILKDLPKGTKQADIDEWAYGGMQGTPKYSQYQLPGGKDYRETLSTLPEPNAERLRQIRDELNELASKPSKWHAENLDIANAQHDKLIAEREALSSQVTPQFRTSHFDTPNILVHSRSNTRTLPTGEPGRFIEEVQSDWHQQGKKKGYKAPDSAIAKLEQELRDLTMQNHAFVTRPDYKELTMSHPDAAAYEDRVARALQIEDQLGRNDHAIPDAPFKDSWPDLGLKQEILAAVDDPSATWIGHTTGATQAARYDLSKQISKVEYQRKGPSSVTGGNAGRVLAYDHDGKVVVDQFVPESDLPDYIGKEAAERILTGENAGRLDMGIPASLSGLDLQVGGEGMRQFYDELLPKRLEKILKPFGGKVERGQISTPIADSTLNTGGGSVFRGSQNIATAISPTDENLPALLSQIKKQDASASTPAWIARLTTEMKAAIKERGLPLLLAVLAAQGALKPAASHEPNR